MDERQEMGEDVPRDHALADRRSREHRTDATRLVAADRPGVVHVEPLRDAVPRPRRDRSHPAASRGARRNAMTSNRLVVALSLYAWLLSAIHAPAPLAFVV